MSFVGLPPDGAGKKLYMAEQIVEGTSLFIEATTELPAFDRRLEWTSEGGENKLAYQGYAAPGSATSAEVWTIEHYTYEAGPASGNVPTLIEVRTGAWDDRATLF